MVWTRIWLNHTLRLSVLTDGEGVCDDKILPSLLVQRVCPEARGAVIGLMSSSSRVLGV
jgi:hypothetical protein